MRGSVYLRESPQDESVQRSERGSLREQALPHYRQYARSLDQGSLSLPGSFYGYINLEQNLERGLWYPENAISPVTSEPAFAETTAAIEEPRKNHRTRAG